MVVHTISVDPSNKHLLLVEVRKGPQSFYLFYAIHPPPIRPKIRLVYNVQKDCFEKFCETVNVKHLI